jgi:hypothetical protein
MKAPDNIANYRAELCRICPTPCEHQNSAEFRADGENECPIGKWRRYQIFMNPAKMQGVGDLVSAFAQPIAGAIDAVFKTNVKGCSACARRREKLNNLLPFQDHVK